MQPHHEVPTFNATPTSSPAPDEPAPKVNLLEQVIAEYIRLRDWRSELKRKYEEEDSKIKSAMARLEVALLGALDGAGVQSLSTASGTTFVQTKSRPVCGDWHALYAHILETKQPNLLWKRLAEREILDAYEATGTLPPGVTVTQERVAIVRVR